MQADDEFDNPLATDSLYSDFDNDNDEDEDLANVDHDDDSLLTSHYCSRNSGGGGILGGAYSSFSSESTHVLRTSCGNVSALNFDLTSTTATSMAANSNETNTSQKCLDADDEQSDWPSNESYAKKATIMSTSKSVSWLETTNKGLEAAEGSTLLLKTAATATTSGCCLSRSSTLTNYEKLNLDCSETYNGAGGGGGEQNNSFDDLLYCAFNLMSKPAKFGYLNVTVSLSNFQFKLEFLKGFYPYYFLDG